MFGDLPWNPCSFFLITIVITYLLSEMACQPGSKRSKATKKRKITFGWKKKSLFEMRLETIFDFLSEGPIEKSVSGFFFAKICIANTLETDVFPLKRCKRKNYIFRHFFCTKVFTLSWLICSLDKCSCQQFQIDSIQLPLKWWTWWTAVHQWNDVLLEFPWQW